jgi:hypothetical protein
VLQQQNGGFGLTFTFEHAVELGEPRQGMPRPPTMPQYIQVEEAT